MAFGQENFFVAGLRHTMQVHHFNQAQLADFLGVDPAYVSRWLKGSSPRLDQLRGALDKMGWSLERARPDYDVFQDAIRQISGDTPLPVEAKEISEVKTLLEDVAKVHRHNRRPTFRVEGTLDSSSGVISNDDAASQQPQDIVDGIGSLMPIPEYAQGDLVGWRIKGDALAPLYPEDTLLLVRRVTDSAHVPDGVEVLFATDREPVRLELRKLVRILDPETGRVERTIGAPVVESQEYLFFRQRDAHLEAVVMAAVKPALVRRTA